MAFNITDFKSALSKGGARPSLFEVSLTFPAAMPLLDSPEDDGLSSDLNFISDLVDVKFMCKASSIPSSTIAPIEVPYFGRKVKFAGNRTFPEWTITVINDENFAIRSAFESWLAAINTHRTNNQKFDSPLSYMSTGLVKQYGKNNSDTAVIGSAQDPTPLRSYQFINVFPSEISPIELNWASENEIEEFTVTLQYDYWIADPVAPIP